ncbi:Metallo-dependent phosphatase-like protein [Mrakia frigida]|uniref:endopolyphosphatase n=1 Tax=Mrakia frigida TaxID=29902 RepID=UPI003FCBFBDB
MRGLLPLNIFVLGFALLGPSCEGAEQITTSLGRAAAGEKKLHGRFIHFTDAHPDPFYTPGTPLSASCHVRDQGKKDEGGKKKKKKKDDEELAGKWGVGPSDCDAPTSLVNLTFDWLEKEWADKVDFVIWTGDNARHDIDRTYPRTPQEIYNLNRMMSSKMYDIFKSKGVPVVPSLGNNDIWPHNILYPGPNAITNEFLDIWHKYIPSEQIHVFQRGAYFTVEVIPDQLAVISLNTLYWYDSNKAVDGCAFGSKDPGALEMDWLDVQLEIFRGRGMQVWLSGHVPPTKGNFFPDCWYRYGELALRYQDTIVGHTYGHMNVDHFFLIDSLSLSRYAKEVDEHSFVGGGEGFSNLSSSTPALNYDSARRLYSEGDYEVMKSRTRSGTLEGDVLRDFKDLPQPKKLLLEDYSIINVSPSVIPTYFPSVRIFTYNTTGTPYRQSPNVDSSTSSSPSPPSDEDDDDLSDSSEDLKKKKHKKKKKKKKPAHVPGDEWCRRRKNRDKIVCQPRIPRHADGESPSRKNTFGTPLGYAQFFLPDVNGKKQPEYTLEYLTYPPSLLLPPSHSPSNSSSTPPPFDPPVPLHLLPPALLVPQPDSFSSADSETATTPIAVLAEFFAPYRMPDLTIGSYIELARKLSEEKKLWKRFLEAFFVGTGKDED